MKKILVLFLALLLLPLGFLAAQEDASPAFSLLSLDLGMSPSYRIGGTYNSVLSLGVNFRVADPLVVGFTQYGPLDNGLSALSLKYGLMKVLNLTLSLGTTSGVGAASVPDFIGGDDGAAHTVAGLGIELAPFSKKVGMFVTDLKLGVGYFFVPTEYQDASGDDYGSPTRGTILFTLSMGVGL